MNYPILKIERLDYQTPLTDIYLFEGVFVYSSKGLFGLIADNFGSIIPPIYEEIIPAFDFHFWGRENQKWKLYDFKNIEINGIEFKHVTTFCNEYACVSRNGSNFGYKQSFHYQLTDYYCGSHRFRKDQFAGSLDSAIQNVIHRITISCELPFV